MHNNSQEKFRKILFVLTPIILFSILIIILFKGCGSQNINYNKLEEEKIIIDGEIVMQPTSNCRAHFSGGFISDQYEDENVSAIYKIDEMSEYVGEGEYPRAIAAFPKSNSSTFDGIAIDNNTRVIIYSEENYKGEILLNENGPAIILNLFRIKEYSEKINEILSKEFILPLNTNYPPSCRKISETNMIDWSKGSLKVICNE